MGLQHTKKQLKRSGLAPSTGALSVGCGSISDLTAAHARGLHCERVAVKWLQGNQITVHAHRALIAGVEVDLLAREKSGLWLLIEVKSIARWEWLPRRLTKSQRIRLNRALYDWMAKSGEPAALWLIVVGLRGEIEVFRDF